MRHFHPAEPADFKIKQVKRSDEDDDDDLFGGDDDDDDDEAVEAGGWVQVKKVGKQAEEKEEDLFGDDDEDDNMEDDLFSDAHPSLSKLLGEETKAKAAEVQKQQPAGDLFDLEMNMPEAEEERGLFKEEDQFDGFVDAGVQP